MNRKSKWIEINSPDEPLADVARRALQARLELVWQYLPRAAAEADEDIEHVHQLRVATRRAVAAVEIFDGLLPNGRKHWVRKKLKHVRRAAGEARDLDVLTGRLRGLCEDADACRGLLTRVDKGRREAQAPINRIYGRLVDGNYPRKISKLVDKVRLRGAAAVGDQPTVVEAARDVLAPLVSEFFEVSAGGFSDFAALHQFRIQGKQLRYAVEIFAGAFPAAMRKQVYPLIEELQEKLGEVNDHVTAEARYREWLEKTDDQAQAELLERLVAHESAATMVTRDAFTQWWTPAKAADLQRQFDELLQEPANMSVAG